MKNSEFCVSSTRIPMHPSSLHDRSDCRSRSPVAKAAFSSVLAEADVSDAHQVRMSYKPPKQSKFRVAALLRFVRPDGSEGSIESVNAEPHDANIRGAICAERAALCQFQRDEAGRGSQVKRVVCVTDANFPIFPGPLCREFLTSACNPDVEVIASGAANTTSYETASLSELLPLPSVYRLKDQDTMKAFAMELGAKVKPPEELCIRSAYEAALACAKRQEKQAHVFPILFAAAVCFEDGRTYAVAELKGIEYGCTVDAVSLLLPEMSRNRDQGGKAPVCIAQVDQFGVAHAPFAGGRALLIEHGFGKVLLYAHKVDGELSPPLTALESIPFANHTEMF